MKSLTTILGRVDVVVLGSLKTHRCKDAEKKRLLDEMLYAWLPLPPLTSLAVRDALAFEEVYRLLPGSA